jgi:hypothetical protein
MKVKHTACHLHWEIKVKHKSLPSAMGNQIKVQEPAICNIKVKHNCLPSAVENQSKTQQSAICNGKSKYCKI